MQCHSATRAKGIGAPAAFDIAAWEVRFNNAQTMVEAEPERFNGSMDYLLHQIKIGKGLMQHGGLCIESGLSPGFCQDDSYRQAIEYMRHGLPKTAP